MSLFKVRLARNPLTLTLTLTLSDTVTLMMKREIDPVLAKAQALRFKAKATAKKKKRRRKQQHVTPSKDEDTIEQVAAEENELPVVYLSWDLNPQPYPEPDIHSIPNIYILC
jgi:hypothetical protein